MTLEEIAQMAGVSRTTASYVINGKAAQYRISEQTQKKVRAVVEKYQFTPNPHASALRIGITRTIGLLIPDLENLSFAKIAKQLEQAARQIGYQVIICSTDDDIETEKQIVNMLLQRKIDALIVASALPADSDFYLPLRQSGLPIIAIDRLMDVTQFACVISEDINGAYQLTQQLLQLPCRRIGLLGAMAQLSISRKREQGFLRATSEAQCESQLIYTKNFSRKEAKESIISQFMQGQLPDALLVTSFTLFEGVLDAIALHANIATQCRFATFGNHRILDYLPINVCSLSQQVDQISQQALELTLKALQGDYQAGIVLLERQLIAR